MNTGKQETSKATESPHESISDIEFSMNKAFYRNRNLALQFSITFVVFIGSVLGFIYAESFAPVLFTYNEYNKTSVINEATGMIRIILSMPILFTLGTFTYFYLIGFNPFAYSKNKTRENFTEQFDMDIFFKLIGSIESSAKN